MSARSILRRIGVTLPFLTIAVLVLGLWSRPISMSSPQSGSAPTPFVIVTTEALEPAFEAFQSWNREMGCPAGMIVLPEARSRDHAKSMIAYLGSLCRLRGAVGLLLGGDDHQVPVLPGRRLLLETAGNRVRGLAMPPRLVPVPTDSRGFPPLGLRVGRAPVRDLSEAWTFVEACRATGLTLDRLMQAEASPSMARLTSPESARGALTWRDLIVPAAAGR